MRFLRLGMGIFIISQGVLAQEWGLVVMGGLLSGLAVFNIGCCGRSACSTPARNNGTVAAADQITYEEVK